MEGGDDGVVNVSLPSIAEETNRQKQTDRQTQWRKGLSMSVAAIPCVPVPLVLEVAQMISKPAGKPERERQHDKQLLTTISPKE